MFLRASAGKCGRASAGVSPRVRACECRQVRAGPITTTAAYDVDEPEVSAGRLGPRFEVCGETDDNADVSAGRPGPWFEVCGETDDNADEEGSSTFACAAIHAA